MFFFVVAIKKKNFNLVQFIQCVKTTKSCKISVLLKHMQVTNFIKYSTYEHKIIRS